MSGQVLGSGIYFNAGNYSRIGEDFKKGGAVLLLLPDGFVVKDHAADVFCETRRGDDQFPIRASSLDRLRYGQLCETFVAGWAAFVHRQQALAVGDQLAGGIR